MSSITILLYLFLKFSGVRSNQMKQKVLFSVIQTLLKIFKTGDTFLHIVSVQIPH